MKLAMHSSDFEENTITFLVPEAVMRDCGFYPCELEVDIEKLMKHPPKPAERKPEAGDVVLWVKHGDLHVAEADAELLEAFATVPCDKGPFVLMRRAEVEARVKAAPK